MNDLTPFMTCLIVFR